MKKCIVFLILTLFFLLLPFVSTAKCRTDGDCRKDEVCRNEECVKPRALEITYPTIPGVATPKDVAVGLPNYINYIFRFAIIFFGILILGILIYNGVNYLLSFGNPTKLADARQGITAGILGGLILFSAYIIFNTINPKLVTLELPPATVVKAVVVPGVYICNYRVTDIADILTKYQSQDSATRNEAAKTLRERMGTPKDKSKICFLVNYSGVLTNFTLKSGSPHTIFIVPEEKYVEGKFEWKYNYGIVLHEKDRFTGRCKLLPKPKNNLIYTPTQGSKTDLGQIDDFKIWTGPNEKEFIAKSITIFKKPDKDPIPEALGVTLYEGLGWNEIGWEEGKTATSTGRFPISLVLAAEDPNYLKRSFKPEGNNDVKIVHEGILSEIKKVGNKDKKLYHNTRSIKIEPRDGYIAILMGDEDDKTVIMKGADLVMEAEKCEVRKTDDANLMDDSIGRCGTCGIIGWSTNWTGLTKCYPCLESMIVVKGQSL